MEEEGKQRRRNREESRLTAHFSGRAFQHAVVKWGARITPADSSAYLSLCIFICCSLFVTVRQMFLDDFAQNLGSIPSANHFIPPCI